MFYTPLPPGRAARLTSSSTSARYRRKRCSPPSPAPRAPRPEPAGGEPQDDAAAGARERLPRPDDPTLSAAFAAARDAAGGGRTVRRAGLYRGAANPRDRRAHGAGRQRRRVRGMVLGQVGAMLLIGGVIGLVGALGLGRAARSLLYGLQARDPRRSLWRRCCWRRWRWRRAGCRPGGGRRPTRCTHCAMTEPGTGRPARRSLKLARQLPRTSICIKVQRIGTHRSLMHGPRGMRRHLNRVCRCAT